FPPQGARSWTTFRRASSRVCLGAAWQVLRPCCVCTCISMISSSAQGEKTRRPCCGVQNDAGAPPRGKGIPSGRKSDRAADPQRGPPPCVVACQGLAAGGEKARRGAALSGAVVPAALL